MNRAASGSGCWITEGLAGGSRDTVVYPLVLGVGAACGWTGEGGGAGGGSAGGAYGVATITVSAGIGGPRGVKSDCAVRLIMMGAAFSFRLDSDSWAKVLHKDIRDGEGRGRCGGGVEARHND